LPRGFAFPAITWLSTFPMFAFPLAVLQPNTNIGQF
jgi:hypothetical protein